MVLTFRMRMICLGASVLTLLMAAAVLWLGLRSAAEVDRLVNEGVLARGTERGRSSEGRTVTIDVSYTVGGRDYAVSGSYNERESLLDAGAVDLPRLGPRAPFQVVYLPGDPAVARLRDKLEPGALPFVVAAGFFGLFGLVFGAVAVLTRPRARRGAGLEAPWSARDL